MANTTQKRARALTILSIGLQPALVVLALLVSAHSLAQSPLQDPTRPDAWRQATLEQGLLMPDKIFRLDSVLFSPQRRVAVINGRTMSEGETRDGLTLVKVHERHATVRVEGKLQDLLLKPLSNVRR